MGIDAAGVRFLLAARGQGVDFARTLTIGRQQLFLEAGDLTRGFGPGMTQAEAEAMLGGERWGEAVLSRLGAAAVESMDASDYEGATIMHDLNRPVGPELEQQFSCVFDGGSLEHVFDFPTALRNCMRMVAVGGHLLTINPFDNYAGHGFYQLGPEVPFRALTPPNGFAIEEVLLSEGPDRWWRLSDPGAVGRRAELRRRRPTLIYVRARRLDDRPPLAEPPQQSDYAAAWAGGSPAPVRRRAPWIVGRRIVGRLLGRSAADPAFLEHVRL